MSQVTVDEFVCQTHSGINFVIIQLNENQNILHGIIFLNV